MRRLYLLLAASLFFPCVAQAMPGMDSGGAQSQDERFREMDKNSDASLSREEFFERFPSMHKAAFKSIDKNGDNLITLEEWLNFSNSHSRDMGGSAMGGMVQNPSGMGSGPVMREMFKEDGGAASQGDSKGRPLFEMKPKDDSQ